MSEHVIAVDPGGRSGWASAIMARDHFELTGSGVLRADKMAVWLASMQHIARGGEFLTPEGYYDVIVQESWRPRPQNGSMAWIQGDPLLSVQHLGQVRLIAQLSGVRYREYPPSAKEGFTASMPVSLRDLNADSNEQHDQDARMHLWGYFFEEWFSATVDPESVVCL